MDKKPLIGVSILAMILLIFGSLSNVVGYQGVQLSDSHTTFEQYQVNNLLIQKEMTQYSNLDCDCGKVSGVTPCDFSIICACLYAIGVFVVFFYWHFNLGVNLLIIIGNLWERFNCSWSTNRSIL